MGYGQCCEPFIDHHETVVTPEQVSFVETEHVIPDVECEFINTDWLNDRFHVYGSLVIPVDSTASTLIVAYGDYWTSPNDETFFRNAIAASPNSIIYLYYSFCDSSHRNIYYKRII